MGSLIFLLLVTTRMIQDRAANPSVAEATPPAPKLPLLSVAVPEPTAAAKPTPPPIVIPSEPSVEPKEPVMDARAIAMEQRLRELDELNARWNSRLEDLNAAREERARLLAQRQQLQKGAAERVAAMKAELQDLEIKLGRMTGELSASAVGNGSAKERIELETQIRELKRRLRAAQQKQDGDNKFEVVPFDPVSGTSRRPILIECTSEGMRFIPENVMITRGDLMGFSHRVNPLIVGSSALINYWTAWNLRQENPGREPEPYVLLLVRPSGTIAYYVAMEMLRDLRQPHGYELLEEDTELQMPPVDAGSKAACEAAVNRLLAEKAQVLRQAGIGRFGVGRSGGGGGAGPGGGGAAGGGALDANASGDSSPVTGSRDAGSASNGKTGSGRSQSGQAEQFELADIISKSDAGNQSWDRVENFEGARRGDSSRQNSKAGAARGAVVASPGNARQGTGAGAGTSSGRFAVTAGGEPADPSQSGSASKPGTVPTAPGSPASNGIESLDDEDPQPSKDADGSQQPGTNPQPDIGLGSSGNRSVPVDDQRGRKRKSTDRDAPATPEELAHRHWGLSEPGAAIGLEREVRIDVEPKRYVIGKKHAVTVLDSDTREDTFAKLVSVLDLQARDWGKPPQGFFWKPSLRYIVADGGDANYERVHSMLERAGLSSSREFLAEHNSDTADKPKRPSQPTPAVPTPPASKPPFRLFRGFLR
jgi:hypothetical protein